MSVPPPGFDPVHDSFYHYIPTASVCVVFIAIFGVSTVVHVMEAFIFRMWWLLISVCIAGVLETVGWLARYRSSQKFGVPKPPFVIQLTATIIAPTFLLSVYFVLLGRFILLLGPQYSRIGHKLYSRIFLTADLVALVVQGVGGVIASSATDPTQGGHIMLGGIVFQMFSLVVYSMLSFEFIFRFYFDSPIKKRVYAPVHDGSPGRGGGESFGIGKPRDRLDTRLRLLLWGMIFSIVCIFIRGVYRTIELSDGWDGPIISTQRYFNFLDGMMIALAMWTLNFLHPGYLFHDDSKQPSNKSLEMNDVY